MKKLIVGLLGWVATLAVQPAAEAGVDKIVYDLCYADLADWELVCAKRHSRPSTSLGGPAHATCGGSIRASSSELIVVVQPPGSQRGSGWTKTISRDFTFRKEATQCPRA